MSQVPSRDAAFMEVINKNMRVPEHLSVGPRQQQFVEEVGEAMRWPEEHSPACTMQVPDRLTYTEAPDMSPRPLFSPSRPIICSPLGLEPCWESPSGEVFLRETSQSPIRRSYSDQSFGRTPPSTPTQLKQALAVPRHPSSSRGSGRHVRQSCTAPLSTQTTDPQTKPFPATPLGCQSPHSMLQAARQLGLQTSQHLLQMVSQKYSAMENWSPEEEGGAAVEFIILRRQVMKMSRRLAVLETHNAERRSTEVIQFSLLFSACLLNAWLWIRR
ncbi:mitochondrial fission factor-like isoform X2 [Seriola lalandi dorsalis]|uniref:mitochondrial fission factor-like isoform X2 n=1 Tax=Seriola lalandi dorsalis TaxID=1841481 RepID=UPI000C6F9485|nr:mitochondrial fission factor-like isoform X2 [Seriola lalandi dorsalis]XP_056252477.1 mitochondrial fission factor-like isoform X2 [Seriola aureovittata]